MKPTRPTPIVAAAVMLIVLGVQALLASLAMMFVVPVGTFWLVSCCFSGSACTVYFVSPLLVVFGFGFIRVGISLLVGTLKEVPKTGYRIWITGVVLVLPTVFATVVFVFTDGRIRLPVQFLLKDILVLMTIWFDVGATVAAGHMLRQHVPRYAEWQKAYFQPASTWGYEDEE